MEKTGPVGRREFLLYMSCDVEATSAFQESALWYTTFLEHKLRTFWTLFRRGLANINESDPLPGVDDMTTAYRFCIAVAKKMSGTADLALVTIVDKLINEELLSDREDREPLYHLVFAIIGWLSMLHHD